MPLNQSFLYSQTSAKLVIEGLPDLSLNQTSNNIGIISTWKLNLIGSSELEGKLIHLKALMRTVLPYARFCVSNVRKKFGETNGSVTISPFNQHHKICLTSSQEGVKPLEIVLDDAELSDLVRCLDSLKGDKRVLVDWELPKEKPLDKSEQIRSRPISSILGIPLIGFFVALSVSSAFFAGAPKNLENNGQTINTNLFKKN